MKACNYGVVFVQILLLLTPNYSYVHTVLGEIKKPNVVLFAVNQLGLGDLGHYWQHLDNIRELSEGAVRFSHVYSQLYPTSSRAALLTGRLPVKTGMLKGRFLPFTSLPSIASSGGLPLGEQTLADILKRNGYSNKFVGLWDQGLGRKKKFLPLNQGFGLWFGIVTQHSETCSGQQQKPYKEFVSEALSVLLFAALWSLFVVVSLWCLYFLKAKLISLLFILGIVLYATNDKTTFLAVRSCVLYRDQYLVAQPYNIENITLRFTDEALDFIKTVAHKQPFFLMVNHLALSKPLFTSSFFKNFSDKSDMFLDSLVELDWSIGSVLKMIGDFNLTDDTVVVFAGLSGEAYANENRICNSSLQVQEDRSCQPGNSLKGSRSSPDNWEEQIQVPLYIKWPKKMTPGRTINSTVTLMDVMPTILDLTNISYFSNALDGKSLLGLMNGTLESLHSYVFHYLDVTRPSAVTHNEYKALFSTMTEQGLVYHDPPLLFNLREDPEEISPLAFEDYREVIQNITEARERHLENRTRKWISQFEHPILPWLFPCANFPYCHRRDVGKLKHVVFNHSTLRN